MEVSLKEKIENRTKEVEEVIYSYLPEESGYQKTVISAMNYTMKAGGKRLRPMLMDETYRMFGGKDRKKIEPFMAAIEMIHTYSLIHDDLPALDNDDYRRGRKTAHVVYGEAMAILAGDALLNYAFETAAKAFRGTEEDVRTARAFQILASKPGIYGMIGGQTADVAETHHDVQQDQHHSGSHGQQNPRQCGQGQKNRHRQNHNHQHLNRYGIGGILALYQPLRICIFVHPSSSFFPGGMTVFSDGCYEKDPESNSSRAF